MQMLIYVTTKPVIGVNFVKLRFIINKLSIDVKWFVMIEQYLSEKQLFENVQKKSKY